MTAFAPLLTLLQEVPDPRRAQGRRYQLAYVLLFAILAIVSGANTYRDIAIFIDEHREALNATFGSGVVSCACAHGYSLHPAQA